MNEHFVCIKVDREERPDLDQIYMNAVQLMTGRGGWPMSVFLTPDLQPFYGGTYWPPSARMGMPGFDQVLPAVADAWQNRRRAGDRAGRRADRAHCGRWRGCRAGEHELSHELIDQAGAHLERAFDHHARRLRRRAEVSASDGSAGAAASVEAASARSACCDMVDAHARQDGGRRHLRSARRRVSSLLGRRALAGAALRKDAVRQRAA